MSGPSDFQPTNPALKWIERRLPIMGLMHSSFVAYPTPRNLNYWWTFGAILSMMLGVQILTGVILAMHYTPHADLAFKSVELLVRDVNYGWLLRNIHASGASMFFFAVYIHMFRGLYYGSYKEPREVLWILGVIIYLLMMATGFMGYVLPWGQMSFWGATVITNLFSAVPYVGESIVTLLWGGYSVGNPTLNRFFSLHYLLPFVIAGVVVLHVWALHVAGQNNPAGVEAKTEKDTVPFTPYATIKDAFGVSCFMLFFAWFIFYMPNYLGDPENYIPANPARDAAAHRAGMVLPAVLRDPAFDPEQACRRHRDVRCDHHPGVPALARQRQDALVKISPAGQAVLLDLRRGLHRARLSRRPAAGRHLCDRRPHPDLLLLRLFPDPAAAALPDREAASGAEFDRRRRAGEVRRQGRAMASAVIALLVAGGLFAGSVQGARAEDHGASPPGQKWSFSGPFGKFDRGALQRGLKVYKEVCSACHGLSYVAFRNLADAGGPGYSVAQASAFASEYKVKDGPNDEGEMFERPGRPADYFPSPFPNEQAARAANGGAAPPDLSLITKARSYGRGFPMFLIDFFTQYQEQGPDYVDALLQGYEDKPPAGFNLPDGSYYNRYFPGHAIKMPKPLNDGQVTYDDGSPATVAQYAKDVTTFLMWTAEPHMEARKALGLQVFVFLILLTVLLYFTKKKVWANAH